MALRDGRNPRRDPLPFRARTRDRHQPRALLPAHGGRRAQDAGAPTFRNARSQRARAFEARVGNGQGSPRDDPCRGNRAPAQPQGHAGHRARAAFHRAQLRRHSRRARMPRDREHLQPPEESRARPDLPARAHALRRPGAREPAGRAARGRAHHSRRSPVLFPAGHGFRRARLDLRAVLRRADSDDHGDAAHRGAHGRPHPSRHHAPGGRRLRSAIPSGMGRLSDRR